ncbi:MAG TPA: glycosyltransferase [Steroidobacteraceae bacterium]|nr:glycosyltransferase [Steroidobacteraceae bacterium]
MSRPLHIVSVCRSLPNPDDPSGGVFVLNRLRAMAETARLHVVQPLPYLPVAKPLPSWGHEQQRTLQGLDVTHAPMLYVPGIFKSADGHWLARSIHDFIARLHATDPIDLIDAHFGYPEGVGCAQVAGKLGIPTFITIRGFENEYVHKRGIGSQMVAAMRNATGCVSVSHSLRQLAVDHGVAPERVRVVHNAIDWNAFNFDTPQAARARLGLPREGRLVVSVGHLTARKRHHILVEAFAKVAGEMPGATLLIIGGKQFEADYPAQLTAQVQALGLADKVKFLGNTPPARVADWLRAADVFALATAREGCCNAVLEALAVGAPVVTTPVGDNAHFVRDGENGFLAPVDDAAALAAALSRALSVEHWQRQQISAQLRQQVGGWNDVAQRVLQFFRERLE